jgi:hypothetical protein
VNHPFDPDLGLIVVAAEVFGPSGSIVLRLALDIDFRRGIISFT